MNDGKNSWTVGWTVGELYKVRVDVTNINRLADACELAMFKTGFLNYRKIDWLFAIYQSAGNCITGDLKYPDGREQSTAYTLKYIKDFNGGDFPLFNEDVVLQFIYLEKLYELSKNKGLSEFEYVQFKRVYHAIQRFDFDIAVNILTGKNGEKQFLPQFRI